MNLPNQLTLARLVMIPIFVGLMMIEAPWAYFGAWAVFIAAAITDWLDGRIARSRNLVTNFGKLMDPMADKVLVASAFVMMMEIDVLHVPGWTIVAILAREFLVTGARSMAATDGSVIAANLWGKTKAMFQMIYIGLFLLLAAVCLAVEIHAPERFEGFASVLRTASHWTIVAVAILTVFSGIQFARSNWTSLKLGMNE